MREGAEMQVSTILGISWRLCYLVLMIGILGAGFNGWKCCL